MIWAFVPSGTVQIINQKSINQKQINIMYNLLHDVIIIKKCSNKKMNSEPCYFATLSIDQTLVFKMRQLLQILHNIFIILIELWVDTFNKCTSVLHHSILEHRDFSQKGPRFSCWN